MLKMEEKVDMFVKKRISDLDWRFILLIILPFSILLCVVLSSTPSVDYFLPLWSFIFTTSNVSDFTGASPVECADRTHSANVTDDKLRKSRIAVCLVGGARRFELTGPSIIERVLKEYPNADLFLHCPMDKNAFKLSLLKTAPRLASVRIFDQRLVPQTVEQVRVLTAANSPNGIQGLLQYFNLVEGCLTMIESYQKQHDFIYDWIVRTRVDGYWNAPLQPQNFVSGRYTVPSGSVYGGLNDRLGIGDFHTSKVALSRLSLIPKLDSAGYRRLNSESAFKAQLTTLNISYVENRLPFCVVTDRTYQFPPTSTGVPVAALSSRGPLSGTKCRPCTPVCKGRCVAGVMSSLQKKWSWTDWANGTIELCDAHGGWEEQWETIFDRVAGKNLAAMRREVKYLMFEKCVADFREMKTKSANWESPAPEEICALGLKMRP